MTSLRIREAVRALVVDPEQRVLLVRFEFPNRHVWATPGGGMEHGETVEGALRRELAEELGLTDFEIGPQVWDRTHIIPFLNGRFDGQHDRCFLVETATFEPAPTLSWEQLNSEFVFEIRWWTPDEVAAFEPSDRLVTAPRRFAQLYRRLLDDGVPDAPFDATD
jgi:8-oxo-dGTP pyrophosphatase MutT (NUDIX family)